MREKEFATDCSRHNSSAQSHSSADREVECEMSREGSEIYSTVRSPRLSVFTTSAGRALLVCCRCRSVHAVTEHSFEIGDSLTGD